MPTNGRRKPSVVSGIGRIAPNPFSDWMAKMCLNQVCSFALVCVCEYFLVHIMFVCIYVVSSLLFCFFYVCLIICCFTFVVSTSASD